MVHKIGIFEIFGLKVKIFGFLDSICYNVLSVVFNLQELLEILRNRGNEFIFSID